MLRNSKVFNARLKLMKSAIEDVLVITQKGKFSQKFQGAKTRAIVNFVWFRDKGLVLLRLF